MLLFIDESGIDHRETPYEVLGGIGLRQHNLWRFIKTVQAVERDAFGVCLKDVGVEMKGKKLLKKKRFKLASQEPEIADPEERRELAKQCLLKGVQCRGVSDGIQTKKEITAYSQAVLFFIDQLIDLCFDHDIKLFSCMVNPETKRRKGDFLHKDYSFLFERYYNYVVDTSRSAMGLIVFDELEKAQARILIGQMEAYFKKTEKGRERSSRIIPEPFFVHSDLTTLIQVADIFIYILNWAYRIGRMKKPVREELVPFAERLRRLQHISDFERYNSEDDRPFKVYSITYIDSLDVTWDDE